MKLYNVKVSYYFLIDVEDDKGVTEITSAAIKALEAAMEAEPGTFLEPDEICIIGETP